MLYLKRVSFYLFLMFFFNCVLFFDLFQVGTLLKVCLPIVLLGLFIYFNFKPRARSARAPSKRLNILVEGYELIIVSTMCLLSQWALYLYLLVGARLDISTPILIITATLSIVLIAIMFINGFIRIFTTSSQLGKRFRLYLLLFGLVPVVNIILFYQCCKTTRWEYLFECRKYFRNLKRKDEKIDKTKYPLLMVHGIFFRDWKWFSYWGRIPDELIKNGAVIYYGNQQSSSSIEQSASEIKERILEIVHETGCEKVNIIAHSKGGLDSRYAISFLDMDKHVASLTTINTPHWGCKFAGKMIEKTPDGLTLSLGNKYNSLFRKLGDDAPDFFRGVSELTAEKCAELNKKMTDREGVVYQSVGSQMYSHSSAPFPLNIGYSMIKPLDGDNDGLVATSSMVWGKYLGTLKAPKKRGISHGDMIDLTRQNIYGFDVCEFYVDLVKTLKDIGL